MSEFIRTIIFAFALSSIAVPAFAQGDGTGMVGQACQADIQQFCAGLAHGGGAVRDCLDDNYDQVSEACRQALDATGDDDDDGDQDNGQ
jgi:hypothetical protein